MNSTNFINLWLFMRMACLMCVGALVLNGCEQQANTHTLFLVDKTNPLTQEQIVYIKKNYLYDNLVWKRQNDCFSVVFMDGKNPTILPYERQCMPLDYDCPWWKCGYAEKQDIKRIRRKTSALFYEKVKEPIKEARLSLLMESLANLTQDGRYRFRSTEWQVRKLVFMTDLYQNSPEFSLISGECAPWEKMNEKTRMYIEKNLADFDGQDAVEIYQFKLRGRKNRACVQDFWKEYFRKSGIDVSDGEKYRLKDERNLP